MPYLLRLDDASEHMDMAKWKKIEKLLDQYSICPLVGIIPQNEDQDLTVRFPYNPDFWELCNTWLDKGWTLAMHGCTHNCISKAGGLNPVNLYSEFADVKYEIQAQKIRDGVKILAGHGIQPQIFFAPAHTFDENTLLALKNNSDIRIISDTIAADVYMEGEFFFIPQQSGKVRRLPFPITTFCYHPNNMSQKDFCYLEGFLRKNTKLFTEVNKIEKKERKRSIFDLLLQKTYFTIQKVRRR